MRLFSIGFVIATLSLTAFAQAQTSPVAEKIIPLATHDCPKPAMPEASKKLTPAETNAVIRALETFRNCVQTFSEVQKHIAATKQKEAEALKMSALAASAAATAAATSADAAAKDYNTFSEQAVKLVTPKEAAEAPKKAGTIELPAARPQRGY